ncbi:Glycerol-3-phosphate dehydrogenase [NAD(P)+] [Wickerhamomyces ciferrii]|uniref:Glycerol-3-phosphate dehydrogenase [NAD(P)+] n=1 Tax=Wickerhamomyces ciferrii (strain ATCC 14091 / BCRC 22168 / CBS 111 / JCM 3599 / NBRC 0793 / NRRL Y-1031 F-60-10) TaxID=1206466 RepID=K0KHE0_WICCF|nr:Glycerol-3-phosphate dehydrogenase [NAD(P)+] [Wickerhamomyces ciferrii]CCH42426.1 Glycerol-3-phosphate dehydrogenase [NAD(P)+] [Wickerhamomyces ciferrii]
MTQTIGFIGSGQMGGGIAKLAVRAGYKVILSNSREPETLEPVINALGPLSSASTPKKIATDPEIEVIVLSVPLKCVSGLLPQLGLNNKIIIDTSNYFPKSDTYITELETGELTTSEYVASFLDNKHSTRLVKAFNNITAVHLKIASEINDLPNQTILPIAGDDSKAKEQISKFINDVGFKTIDIGELKQGWKTEPNTPIHSLPYFPEIPDNLSNEETIEFLKKTAGDPLSYDEVNSLLKNAENDQYIGGRVKDFPKPWAEVFVEMKTKMLEAKSNNTTILL